MWAASSYARPQRFPLVTFTVNDVTPGTPTVPFSTTVTLGLHPAPVVGFPFPGGGAATATETLRLAAASVTSINFTFMSYLL